MTTVAKADSFATRLKKTDVEKFTEICYTQAGKLLRISDRNEIARLLGSVPVQRTDSRSSAVNKKAVAKGKHPSSNKIFGSTLSDGTINRILPVVKFLNSSESLRVEGLFRKCGNCGRQRILREKLDSSDDVDRLLSTGSYSVHDCAGILKAFIAELPEPLLTDRHFTVYCMAADLNVDDRLQLVQIVLQFLPPPNARLLRLLLELLRRTTEQPENKMSAGALGVAFAPHLIIPRKSKAAEIQAVSASAIAITSFLIVHSSSVFHFPTGVLVEVRQPPQQLTAPLPVAAAVDCTDDWCPSKPVERRCAIKRSRGKAANEELCELVTPEREPASNHSTGSRSKQSRCLSNTIKRMLCSAHVVHDNDNLLAVGPLDFNDSSVDTTQNNSTSSVERAPPAGVSPRVVIVDVFPTSRCTMRGHNCPLTGHYTAPPVRRAANKEVRATVHVERARPAPVTIKRRSSGVLPSKCASTVSTKPPTPRQAMGNVTVNTACRNNISTETAI